MYVDIKEVVKKTYSDAANKKSGCGCGPGCCSPQSEMVLVEDYDVIQGYKPIADLGLGCGIPSQFLNIKEGDTVLDLGSGAGNDAFIAAQLVGPKGKVIGIDMTSAMIRLADKNKRILGLNQVEFIEGDIEDLPLQDSSVDIAMSNCVINLAPDKNRVFVELYRVLKRGGRFSISDIVLESDLPKQLVNSLEMYVGCIAGASTKRDYMKSIEQAGFRNISVVVERQIALPDSLLQNHLDNDELVEYRRKKRGILSVTICAEK